jgi:hypothetical protein
MYDVNKPKREGEKKKNWTLLILILLFKPINFYHNKNTLIITVHLLHFFFLPNKDSSNNVIYIIDFLGHIYIVVIACMNEEIKKRER